MCTLVVFAPAIVHFVPSINIVSIRKAVTNRASFKHTDVHIRPTTFPNLTERVMLCSHMRRTIRISTFFPFR
ncbi:hypothetical protein EDC04DRAFT_2766724 [Pisolithus marmoratus]|nr:hypothetical protein EDC04DRAFT_2766724 [Pisolithus marmoratus]